MKYLINCLLVSFFCCTAALAGSPQAIFEANRHLDELYGDFDRDYAVKANRVMVHNLLENLVTAIDRTVPRLSPKERKWVENEIKKSGSTAERALGSREYALKELNDWIDECSYGLKDIKAYQESENSLELAEWISLKECAYFDEIFDKVYQSELPEVKDLSVSIYLAQLNFRTWVFDKVLSDYLAAEMGWEFSPQF